MTINKHSSFIDINDAAELTGYATKYLRKLAKGKRIDFYKTKDSLMVSWQDVQRLATQKPFWVTLPDRALQDIEPDAGLLLHTPTVESKEIYPFEFFCNKVELGNCIDWMKRMPPKIIQSVVTSPPYWGVRKYPGEQKINWADGSHNGFGEEATVEEYVAHTLEVLRHLKRVLKDNGTIWWNLGDTYQTRAYLRESSRERLKALEGQRSDTWRKYPNKRYSSGHSYLKDKDLTMVPFMVALGAQHLGFYVRSMIVWYKDNTVPEPTTDRPTSSHEYILLLAKSRFYKYDKNREMESAITGEAVKRVNGKDKIEFVGERNLRTVWQFPTSSRHGEHTAAFPLELPLRCLKLTTTSGDLVFDPFAGSGTTLAAAKILNCQYFGCDISEQSVQDAERRLLAPAQPLNGKQKMASEKSELLVPRKHNKKIPVTQAVLLEQGQGYSLRKKRRNQ
ncbi:MAG: hypothetical protein B6D41_14365 [Chloroflexi bacterium UTCFX4]|jgi:DNA modification methylase|nr:MAG: hypothetical protein B6D41_14365 [Chloroflexi bacterium UTCFX4]